jgi:hypothetical protein
MRGGLVGKTIRVKAWKVASEEVPDGRDEQVEWLYENWAAIDSWLIDGAKSAEPAIPVSA